MHLHNTIRKREKRCVPPISASDGYIQGFIQVLFTRKELKVQFVPLAGNARTLKTIEITDCLKWIRKHWISMNDKYIKVYGHVWDRDTLKESLYPDMDIVCFTYDRYLKQYERSSNVVLDYSQTARYISKTRKGNYFICGDYATEGNVANQVLLFGTIAKHEAVSLNYFARGVNLPTSVTAKILSLCGLEMDHSEAAKGSIINEALKAQKIKEIRAFIKEANADMKERTDRVTNFVERSEESVNGTKWQIRNLEEKLKAARERLIYQEQAARLAVENEPLELGAA